MQQRTHKPPTTFGIETSREMLEKFKRELERMGQATDPNEATDHGLNAAMTAWHLCDWVWADVKRSSRKAKLAARIGIRLKHLSKEELKKYAVSACPEIGHCQSIATSAKHFGSYEGPDIGTDLTSTEREVPSHQPKTMAIQTDPLGTKISFSTIAWDLWIIEGETGERAAEAFQRAFEWWTKFIDEMLA